MTNKPLGPKELQQRGISRVTPASVVPSKPMATPLGFNGYWPLSTPTGPF